MPDDRDSINRLADAFFAAVEAGDLATIAAIYDRDAVIWKSFDQVETSAAQSLAYLTAAQDRIEQVAYKDIRRHFVDGGFVQQHRYTCVRRSDGRTFDFPACLVVSVRDGKFTRIDEYYDSREREKLISEA